MMVAWHEVPGKRAERIRPVGYGVIGVLSSIPSSRTNAIRYDVLYPVLCDSIGNTP